MRNTVLYILLLLILVIFALHILANAYYLYYLLWWFDIPMHFLGGVFVGLGTLWLYFFSGYIKKEYGKNLRTFLLLSITWTIAIGVGWELFEYALDASGARPNYFEDTALDLVMDIAGATVAAFAFKKTS